MNKKKAEEFYENLENRAFHLRVHLRVAVMQVEIRILNSTIVYKNNIDL
jgi:hypothetical protein